MIKRNSAKAIIIDDKRILVISSMKIMKSTIFCREEGKRRGKFYMKPSKESVGKRQEQRLSLEI
ncbi:hypothetical protein [Psychrobacillus sp. FSL K6-2843]|uniref:hypothetical protein n=1 Tax=Psychrobacillus sp. FSL K6-2843 TaxID=2921549 RepID=UPI00315A5F79